MKIFVNIGKMKKIILIIALNLISSASFSAEIVLNCKFFKIVQFNPYSGNTVDLTKEFMNTEKDIIIKIDTGKNKLTMNDTDVYDDKVTGSNNFKKELSISDNSISWRFLTIKSNSADISYNLNRLTGVLDVSLGSLGYFQSKYNCSQQNKKF